MRHSRFSFPAACAALLLSPSAFAGEVTVHEINVYTSVHEKYTGEVTALASGSMPHAPAYIVSRDEPYIVDICGNAYGYAEDRYGDKALGEAFFTDGTLSALSYVAENGTWGIDAEGSFYGIRLNGQDSRQPSSTFAFEGEGIPEAAVFLETGDASPMFIDDRGRLVEVDTGSNSIDGLRRVAGATGLNDVVAGIHSTFIDRDSKQQRIVFLVRKDGSALALDVIDDGNTLSLGGKPEIYPGDFSDTKKLFGWNNADESIFRLTTGGKLKKLKVRDAVETEVSLPAPVYGRVATKENGTIFYASTSGSFAECAAPVAEVVAEPEKFDDKGVLKYLERTEALYDRLLPYFDKIEEAGSGMGTLQNDQLIEYFEPYADAIRNFRAKDEGQVLENFAQLERDYGGESGLYDFLVEATDGEVRGFSWKINELINRYEKYSEQTIPGIAQSLSSRASIAIQIAEFKGADKTDEKMALYENALKAASWAHFFDPELPGPDELKAQMGAMKAAAEEAERQALEDNVWPGSFDRYTGGDAAGVEAAALDYMQTRYPGEILKVAIAGNWYVYKENVYGEPISYCIPLHVGMINDKDPTRGYINTGSICTQGNQPNPPFSHYAWLSDSEIIKIERLK